MTKLNYILTVFYDISIHTPARGVTALEMIEEYKKVISIHTPARGVTIQSAQCRYAHEISIHTPARGVTLACTAYYYAFIFQSTLPQGE